jgi:hypothetical protein
MPTRAQEVLEMDPKTGWICDHGLGSKYIFKIHLGKLKIFFKKTLTNLCSITKILVCMV